MTASDTGGELRERAEAICMNMPGLDFDDLGVSWHERIAYVEDALRDLLAERDNLAAQVQAVEGLAEELRRDIRECHAARTFTEGLGDLAGEASYAMQIANLEPVLDRLRRALGTPRTGGGE